MLVYALKRLIAMIPTLLGITFVTFMIIRMAPGDPVEASIGGTDAGPATDAASSGASSGGSKADAIKAKKKLLGFMREDYAVQAWDATEAATAQPRDDKYRKHEYMTHEGGLQAMAKWPWSLALTPDGKTLYVGTEDAQIAAIDPEEGTVRAQYDPMRSEVWALAVSPNGAWVAASDAEGTVRVLDARGKTVGEMQLENSVADVVFVDDDRFLSACNDAKIRLHKAPSCEVEREFTGHIADVRALAVAADGSRFWSGGYDQKLREWKLDSDEPVRELGKHGQPINAIALAPDGSFLVTGCHDKLVRVIDLTPTEGDAPDAVRTELRGHFQAVRAVAISPDGKVVFSGGDDKTVRGWILAEERQSVQSQADTGAMRSLLVSPDGARLWTASDSWAPVPMWRQYVNWTGKIVRLDFDRSFFDNEPVIDKIKQALPVTVGLNVLAILIIYGVSIPIGILAAVKRGTTFDNTSSIVLFMLWSMPNFWLATMTIMWFSSTRNFNWFPSVGLHAQDAQQMTYLPWLKDWGMHLVLPLVAMTYGGFASLSRFVRTSMLETIAQDFVRTARAKGLSEMAVIFKHAFRNSLITIITLVGNLLPAMIGGSVIIEYIFSIDGMGKLGFDAILSRDYPVVMAVTTFAAILTLLGILVSDLMYGLVDPRISHE